MKLSELLKHPDYQRVIRPWRVRDIVKDFRPIRCLPLIISKRRNKLFVVDGWHRRTALLELGESTWDAIVYTGLSAREEAREFRAINENRNPLSVGEKFNARVFEKEKDAMGILDIMEETGFVLRWKSPCSPDDQDGTQINAIQAVDMIYQRDDGETLRHTLKTIRDLWGTDDRWAVENSVMKGVALFIGRYNGANGAKQFDIEHLKSRLVKKSASSVIRDADTKYNDLSGRYPRNRPTCVAIALADLYNSGLGRDRKSKLDPAALLSPRMPRRRRARGGGEKADGIGVNLPSLTRED